MADDPYLDNMSKEDLTALRAKLYPEGKDVAPIDMNNPTAPGVTGATLADMGRGAYHGLASDFVPGVGGLPGNLVNPVYNWATDSNKELLPEPPTIRGAIRHAEQSTLGHTIPEDKTYAGGFARDFTNNLPMLALPAAGATAGAGAGIARGFGSQFGRRLMGNVVAPALAGEAAGAATGGNDTAKFVASLLAGRSANPFGGKNQLAMEKAMKEIGAKGGSFLDKNMEKTVVPNQLAKFGKVYDDLIAKHGLKSNEDLHEVAKAGLLSTADKALYEQTKKQFGIAHGLKDLSQENSTGQATPKELRDAITDTTSQAHNVASRLSPKFQGTVAPVVGALLGGGVAGGAGGALGDKAGFPGLSTYAGLGGAGAGGLAGHFIGGKMVGKALPVLNPYRAQALFGNNAGRSAAGWIDYSNPLRSGKEEY